MNALELWQAWADWNEGRLYFQTHRDRLTSYRLKATGRIAPYSKALKAMYPDCGTFHHEAKKQRPV